MLIDCQEKLFIVALCTYPLIEVLLINHDKADLAIECQVCRNKESDFSVDFSRNCSAVASGKL